MKHNLYDMMCLDIYLSHISDIDYKVLKIDTKTNASMPLLSWDLYKDAHQQRLKDAKKASELQQVLSFAEKFKWQNDINLAFLENDYEALIITDKNQNVIWVNEGFTEMTGYSKKFAINKTPRFLQGKSTNLATKKRVRERIIKNQPFKTIITNYKKDNTPYKCEVKIIPLYNNDTTHFIAFEKQVV
ncbi:MAG: PAS domain-containing protein [Flavobacteriaceae bacterium]|nr:PAS domain-containing protein [Flavobacteriaceae bacterium]